MKILHDKMLVEIQKKQLNATELSVFTPTGALGKKATKKERVKQAFYKEKLGMKLNEEEDKILHVRIEKPEDNPDMKEEREEEEEEEEESSEEGVETQEAPTEGAFIDPLEESDNNNNEEEEEEETGPKGPTYMEEINKVIESAPKGINLRINDDSVEDLRRIKEDLEAAIPSDLKKKAYFVNVNRKPKIVAIRSQLPVCAMEQEIMEAINYHDVVIICGETGSGKTTQVEMDITCLIHRFLSFCMKLAMEPRKVAIQE